MRALCLLLLTLMSCVSLAEENLDDELEQEWGHKKVEAKQAHAPHEVYKSRLALLVGARDTALIKCAHARDRYCRRYAQEQFRRDKRSLDKEFDQLPTDEKVEDKDVERKIFDRAD